MNLLFCRTLLAVAPRHVAQQRRGVSMSMGIVGIPNVGKSTLFNALTSSQLAQASNYPFCTIEPNIGVVGIPDPNLDLIGKYFNPKKYIVPEIKLVDIAGLVRGASKNQGLGNKFLSNIRQVDAILHCVRCFDDDVITHVEGNVDPIRDIEIINTELILRDIETVENSLERAAKKAKVATERDAKSRKEFLEKCLAHLTQEKPALSFPTEKDSPDEKFMKELDLLTLKKVLYVANVDEVQIQNYFSPGESKKDPKIEAIQNYATKTGSEVVLVSAKTEAEFFEMKKEEKAELLASLGMKEPALATVARKSYDLLGLQSFYTAGEQEVRAWTIQKGSTASKAAGAIHSDIERGFIRAETFSISDLLEHGSFEKIKAAGKLRSEGKEYVVRDDDVIHFLFNVSKSKK